MTPENRSFDVAVCKSSTTTVAIGQIEDNSRRSWISVFILLSKVYNSNGEGDRLVSRTFKDAYERIQCQILNCGSVS
jgi:hypothetical protein